MPMYLDLNYVKLYYNKDQKPVKIIISYHACLRLSLVMVSGKSDAKYDNDSDWTKVDMVSSCIYMTTQIIFLASVLLHLSPKKIALN